MLKIRFLRVGKKNAPIFRLVLADKDAPVRGRFLEILGFYNPYTKERGVKKDRIQYWLSKGAQASDTAHNFLIKTGVIIGTKIAVHAKSKKVEEKKEAAPAAAKADVSADSSAKASAEAPQEEQAQVEEGKEAPVEQPAEAIAEVPAKGGSALGGKEEVAAPVAE